MSTRGPAPVRTHRGEDFSVGDLVTARHGRRVAVVIPARDEAETVGRIVATITAELTAAGGGAALVDEVLVVDDGSRDATAERAVAAGARVVRSGGTGGKGRAMAEGLAAASGDVVLFLDADVEDFSVSFVTGMLGPVLTDDDVALVKGSYARPFRGEPSGGGRVTELVARPLLDLFFPELASVHQPLAGETCAPRSVLEKLEFAPGYGVEIGLLLDVAERFGAGAIAQVDLGTRVHRNRPLAELRPQAADVLRTALQRAGAIT